MSKQRVVVEAVLAGKSQREVARLYGISQPRVSQLVAAWRAGGWDAVESVSSCLCEQGPFGLVEVGLDAFGVGQG